MTVHCKGDYVALEIRRIILSRDEFSSALLSYRRAHEGSIRQGAIKDCQVSRDSTGLVKIQQGPEEGEAMLDVVVPQPVLTEVLLRFCLENNIAMPRLGRKSAVSHAGRAALEVHVGQLDDVAGTPVASSVAPTAARANR